jgi:hypothetical protein
MMRYVFVRHVGEKPRYGLYPAEMRALSTYNAEIARGIMHNPEWVEAMAELQARYDKAIAEERES